MRLAGIAPAYPRPPNANHCSFQVVYMWSLPPDTTEAELVPYCQPFGTVVAALALRTKRQALIEMDTLDAAGNVVVASRAHGGRLTALVSRSCCGEPLRVQPYHAAGNEGVCGLLYSQPHRA